MGTLVCIMAVSITNGTLMVSLQLRVLPRYRGTLGILCRKFDTIFVWRVGLLATFWSLVVSPIPSSLVLSLPLLVIGASWLGRFYCA